jgi:hypothetical protein
MRFVHLGQSSDHGQKDLHARIDAPDGIRLNGTVDRLARILLAYPRHLPAGVPNRNATTLDEWRAVALGVLAQPLLAARIFADDQQCDLFNDLDPDGLQSPRDDRADHQPERDDQEPIAAIDPALREAILREVARRLDPATYASPVLLHVHLSEEALRTGDGIARVEHLGPQLLSTVRDWLASNTVKIKLQPHIHPDDMPAVDAYEVPVRMQEALLARSPASVFPWTNSLGRHLDVDHTVPFVGDGPPGQTGLHNLGPLSRREHRFKTFGRISVRQPEPGTLVWRTKLGRTLITNPSGTFDLGNADFGRAVWLAVAPPVRKSAA